MTRRRNALRVLLLASGVVALGVAAAIATAPFLTESSYWARIIAWRNATADDYATKFPARDVLNAPPMFVLHEASAHVPAAYASITYPTNKGPMTASLDEFLSNTGTRALLVVRDDELVIERYANGSSHNAIQTSFSMAKSFDSTMIGIAIGEGAIVSVDDPVVSYIPELSGRGMDHVTIRQLLGMDSGLRYDGAGAGGLPWQDDARTYYDPDLRALALSVTPAEPPATRWIYNNYHPLLLGLVLERATGRPVAEYLSEKIWQPLGMEAPASWASTAITTDSRRWRVASTPARSTSRASAG
ncbi:MAG TPA: serine hydrolase domain-containing protein [Chloroflexota bacterium]